MNFVTPEVVNDRPDVALKMALVAEHGHMGKIVYRTMLRVFYRTMLSERQNHRCCYCGIDVRLRLKKRTPTIEHIVPACRGGDTIDWDLNLVMSCLRCNNRRGHRSSNWEEWVWEQHSIRKARDETFACTPA